MNIEDVKNVARLRESVDFFKSEKARLLSVVTESPEYKKLDELHKRTLEAEQIAADFLRNQALDQYKAESQKKVGFGIEIKISKTARIVNESAMREWCLSNFTPALRLDTKLVEKAALSGNIPETMYQLSEEPKVMLPTDLSEYLDSQDE